MMDDLISRQAALDAVTKYCIKYDLRELLADIECLPTAEPNDEEAFEEGYTKAQMELKDAYKPKKGKWKMVYLDDGDTELECDVCGEFAEMWYMPKYCPHCGARMGD